MDAQLKDFTSVYIDKIPRCALSVIEWVKQNLGRYKESEIAILYNDIVAAKDKMANNSLIHFGFYETDRRWVIAGKVLPAKASDEYFIFISAPKPKEAKQNELFFDDE